MPTLIPYAKPPLQRCLQALTSLQLPNLLALLRLLQPGQRHEGEEDSLTPLPETLRAQALGLPTQDGLVPWAALDAMQLHLASSDAAEVWAWLSPCHWQVNSDHVRMADPDDSRISEAESRALMETMRSYFAEDGVQLHGWHHGRWLASGAVFRDLQTASLARAAGGAVDHWLPRQPQARSLRRLQNEMQMLLYSHPVNDARTAANLLPINSFWVSGTGTLPKDFAPNVNTVDADIAAVQEAALRDDAPAWTQAWQALDAHAIAALLQQARAGQPVELTLCAENSAQTFTLQPRSLWARLTGRSGPNDIAAMLQNL
jgi:hypothetical protein